MIAIYQKPKYNSLSNKKRMKTFGEIGKKIQILQVKCGQQGRGKLAFGTRKAENVKVSILR